ncbi:FKBP-type peptidyl-prolyl cis-trans isomerase [Jatrophihabitans endophyticus]|uniref:FKBP-type peptidyl-prolyl cis-trans isomerase n=1 Tax=Jatrophihabitans endophyticus TaxID=1206085 RepID=UPI001A0757A4|nr:FKBP-type peptidyl-prolyl cis-trans isomerase [Jatrophihabitans endophyticus]MBE7189399.1 FKBP-type peptidyl-prolyl cis-trans isomerase [Jatrophihabitans endophyticus]
MPPNNKRRETTRRQLEQRLQERQQREAARKRTVLIASVGGTVLVIAVVLILVFTLGGGGGGGKTPSANGGKTKSATSTTPTSAAPTTPSTDPTDTPCKVTHPKGSVVFDGVTVANPTNLKTNPNVTACSKATPKTLEYKDLVVGKGAAPKSTSTVDVQYAGVFLQDGYPFDSSWKDTGKPTTFALNQVVQGFTLGIAGDGKKVPPMKVGGRRIIVLPASLAYGANANGGIPANTPLVFVVDLTGVK